MRTREGLVRKSFRLKPTNQQVTGCDHADPLP